MLLAHYVLLALGAPVLALYHPVPYCPESNKKRNTFLWRVRHRKMARDSYLFGTIHVPYTEVWDWLDPTVMEAFRQVSSIVFELDLGNDRTLNSLSQCQLLPPGKQIKQALPHWLYQKLRNYLGRVRRDLSVWIEGSGSTPCPSVSSSRRGSRSSKPCRTGCTRSFGTTSAASGGTSPSGSRAPGTTDIPRHSTFYMFQLNSLSQCQLLPPGKQIKQALPHWLYQKLRSYLGRVRRDLSVWIEGSAGTTDIPTHSTFYMFQLNSLSQCQLLPPGKQIKQALPHWLYQKLRNYLGRVRRDLSVWIEGSGYHRHSYAQYLFRKIAGNWKRKRPIWVMLAIQALTPDAVRTSGVPVFDLYLARLARALGKSTHSIEKVKEQCRPLNRLRQNQVIYALNQTLYKHQKLLSREVRSATADSTRDLIRHYNCGQLDRSIFKKDVLQLKDRPDAISEKLNNYFHRKLIQRRNRRMAKRASRVMKRNRDKSFFFAFGAGHFLGRRSVIHWLRKRGFSVTRVEASTNLRGNRHSQSPGVESQPHFLQLLGPSAPPERPKNYRTAPRTVDVWFSPPQQPPAIRSWRQNYKAKRSKSESLWQLKSRVLSLLSSFLTWE